MVPSATLAPRAPTPWGRQNRLAAPTSALVGLLFPEPHDFPVVFLDALFVLRDAQAPLALERAQHYCHQTLAQAYAIADGQRIPERRAATSY